MSHSGGDVDGREAVHVYVYVCVCVCVCVCVRWGRQGSKGSRGTLCTFHFFAINLKLL